MLVRAFVDWRRVMWTRRRLRVLTVIADKRARHSMLQAFFGHMVYRHILVTARRCARASVVIQVS